jgi:uncharacterized protein (TIGR02145 family)
MKKIIMLTTSILSLYIHVNAQKYGSLTDSRDGKTYKTVIIGNQEWMAEDLATTKFTNGDVITNLEDKYGWSEALTNKTPAWCKSPTGKSMVYNGLAVIDKRQLCPIGWRIPDVNDWDVIVSKFGGYENASVKLKANTGWAKYFEYEGGSNIVNCTNCYSWSDEYKRKVACHKCKDKRYLILDKPKIWKSGNGNNLSGFSAKPGGGKRLYDGQWSYLDKEDNAVYYWTLYSDRPGTYTYLIIRNWMKKIDWMDIGYSYFGGLGDNEAVSVRCIKD